MISHHLVMFGGDWSSLSEVVKYLVCHVTSRDHVIQGSCDFKGGAYCVSSPYQVGGYKHYGCRDIMIFV